MEAQRIEIRREVLYNKSVTDPQGIADILAAIKLGEEVGYFVTSPGFTEDTLTVYNDQGEVAQVFRILGGRILSDGEKQYVLDPENYQKVINALLTI